jgi:hypothetical protein
MRSPNRHVLASFACGMALLAATNTSWQNKDFKSWTAEDARALMTDSPWAKRIPLPASGRPSVTVIEPGSNVTSPPAASLGNSSNTTSGANMSVPSIGGSNGAGDPDGMHNVSSTPTPSGVAANTGAPSPPSTVTIIWASATPVRLAVLKLRSATNPPSDSEITHASHVRPNYVIAVVGLPAPAGGSDPKALAEGAFLETKGKSPLQAADSDYRRIGNSDVYFFRFPRISLPLSPENREVEFKMSMGGIELKKKFALTEMQYKGQLAL